MLKTILRQVKQYKTTAILTPVWTTAEVIMGVLIPYVTASIIDKGINAGDTIIGEGSGLLRDGIEVKTQSAK